MTAVDQFVTVLAEQRPEAICPGTNAFIHLDRVDGNWVTTCPGCKTPRLTNPTPWPSYRTVEAHRGRR